MTTNTATLGFVSIATLGLALSGCATDSEPTETFRVVALESLVRMKLVSFRDKDRVHLRDLIDVGLVDESWTERFPPELASRLRQLLESPDG